MRCRYCGSTSLHADKQHKTFSTGKAVAGAVVFGPSGAIAGMIGKDQEGYRCGVCGAFMDAPMDLLTEHSIDSAISDAEAGRGTSKFQYYQKQYPNIRASIPVRTTNITEQISLPSLGHGAIKDTASEGVSTVKHLYRNLHWIKDCPIYVEKIIIHNSNAGDTLSLEAWNQGHTTIRSVYFQATVYDDTSDEIGKCQCVYQGLSIAPGQCLPIEQQFPLQSDLAYRVELICEKIALSDDSVWRASPNVDEVTLSVQPELEEMGFPRLKYVRQHIHEISQLEEEDPLYLPIENSGYWQCICGQPVITNCTCSRCGSSIEKLNNLLSQENLQKMQQDSVKAIAAKRAEATMSLYEQAVHQETESQYQQAFALQYQDTEESLNQAIALYNAIPGYKDSTQRVADCQKRIPILKEELRQKRIEEETASKEKQIAEAAAKKHSKTIAIFSGIAIVLIIAITIVITQVVMPLNKYKNAEKLLVAGDYDGAIAAFAELGDFGDAAEQLVNVQTLKIAEQYEQAEILLSKGNVVEAAIAFGKLGNYNDAKERSFALWENIVIHQTISTSNASVNDHTVGLTTNGHVVAVGDNRYGQCDVGSWTDIVEVSAGNHYTVGLKSDGSVVAVGENDNGQCNVNDWTDIVSISADSLYTVGLKSDGTVMVTEYLGDPDYVCDVSNTNTWNDIVAISTAFSQIVGLKSDGTVVIAGSNEYGQCNVDDWTDIVAISADYEYTIGVKADGTVVATGRNQYGVCDVGSWKDIVTVSVGSVTAGLKADGTVVTVGYNDDVECDVSGWRDIVAISAGIHYVIGLKADGTMVATEYPFEIYDGQCNVFNWTDIKMPN